jgi:hypothetical protein
MSCVNSLWADNTAKYVSVEDGSDNEDRPPVRRSPSSIVSVSRLFYFTSLFSFAVFPILIVALFVLHGRLAHAYINDGFLKGFTTELGISVYLNDSSGHQLTIRCCKDPIKSALATETVRFTGGLHYHKNGTLYRETIEGQPQYVGEPSPEIDSAWNRLLKGK